MMLPQEHATQSFVQVFLINLHRPSLSFRPYCDRTRAFHQTWPSAAIRQTLSGNSADLNVMAKTLPLPWSAYVRLLSVKNEAARRFYETEALRCGWSMRQLDRQVNSQFYERIALLQNEAAMRDISLVSEISCGIGRWE